MPSVVEICNMALALFGGSTINSLSEASESALYCNMFYEQTRDAVLREFNWNFASKIVTLAQVSETVPEWDYVYKYPPDCVAARRVFNADTFPDDEPIPFEVIADSTGKEKLIACDLYQAKLQYTARITDPAMFEPQFVDALSWRLSSVLSVVLSGNMDMRQQSYAVYQNSLAAAWTMNANEGHRKAKQSRSYIEVRK